MPDITMCLRNDCPMRNSCYRFTATPSDYQSYSTFNLMEDDDGGQYCKDFWNNNPPSLKRKEDE